MVVRVAWLVDRNPRLVDKARAVRILIIDRRAHVLDRIAALIVVQIDIGIYESGAWRIFTARKGYTAVVEESVRAGSNNRVGRRLVTATICPGATLGPIAGRVLRISWQQR